MQWRDQLWLQQRMREDTQALPSDTCGWLISSFHSLLVMLRSLQTAVLRYREMASATMFRHGARGSSSYVSPLFFFVCVDSTWTYETTHKKPTSPGINRGPLRAVSSASNRIDLARELAASSCSSALSSHRPSGPRIQEISLGPSSQHFLNFAKRWRYLHHGLRNWELLSRRCTVGDLSGTAETAIIAAFDFRSRRWTLHTNPHSLSRPA
ncbi:uncharacterized protein LOC142768843 isoform X4 [Rhipicephalus microplus]|uniref:uncharacterized protein LOC142768843 isoform X4 n=1 Tax=Rhipicephalus microplus TaxID=6941 RepID=UPI003F6BB1C9